MVRLSIRGGLVHGPLSLRKKRKKKVFSPFPCHFFLPSCVIYNLAGSVGLAADNAHANNDFSYVLGRGGKRKKLASRAHSSNETRKGGSFYDPLRGNEASERSDALCEQGATLFFFILLEKSSATFATFVCGHVSTCAKTSTEHTPSPAVFSGNSSAKSTLFFFFLFSFFHSPSFS